MKGNRLLSQSYEYVFVSYFPLEVELDHLLVGVADAHEGADLCVGLRGPLLLHLLSLPLPSAPEQVDTGRRAEKPVTQTMACYDLMTFAVEEVSQEKEV